MSLVGSRREHYLFQYLGVYMLYLTFGSAVNNPKVSDEAKESAKERLHEMGE